jgi:hypothetical protein
MSGEGSAGGFVRNAGYGSRTAPLTRDHPAALVRRIVLVLVLESGHPMEYWITAPILELPPAASWSGDRRIRMLP